QGDGWNHALGELNRFYDEAQHRDVPPAELSAPAGLRGSDGLWTLAAAPTPPAIRELAGSYIESAQVLGRRTAELHLALSSDTSSSAFAPEPLTREDVSGLTADAVSQLQQARDLVRSDTIARAERLLHQIRDAQGA